MDNRLEAGSIIEKIAAAREEQDRFEAIIAEKREEYGKALNGVASTPNGQIVLRILRQACGADYYQKKLDPARLVEENGKRAIWFEAIHQFLTPESKEAIER